MCLSCLLDVNIRFYIFIHMCVSWLLMMMITSCLVGDLAVVWSKRKLGHQPADLVRGQMRSGLRNMDAADDKDNLLAR